MNQRLHLTALTLTFLLAVAQAGFAQTATVTKPKPAKKAAAPAYSESTPGAGPARNEDWFVTVWKERRKLFAAKKPEQLGAVVFLGDSITQGWSEDFRGLFKDSGLKIANRGISGDITRGILARLDEDVISLDPRGIVLLVGTNDIGVGLSPKDIASNMKLILDRLTEHNAKMPIVLCKVMPSSTSKDRPADKIRDLNDRLEKLAKDYQQVTVLDTYTLFANADGDAQPEEFPDLLHPNDIGYHKWHDALVPVLEKAGLLEANAVSR